MAKGDSQIKTTLQSSLSLRRTYEPAMITEKQAKLAENARQHPEHRFKNLYQLLHWQVWMEDAAHRVLSRKGSLTAGVDGKTRDGFKKDYERQLAILINQLKTRTYRPQPVLRVNIPKPNGKTRPLGIPMPPSYCTSYRGFGDFVGDRNGI